MKQFSRASKIDRSSLLTYKAKPQPHSRVPLVTKFHPSIPTLHKHVKESWQILKQDPKLGEMCLQPPIAATRQPANLRALLVHTKLSRKENFGNTPCGKARCQVCDHMMIDQSLNLTHSKCTIRPGRLNCDSENVTYILICSKCPEGIYVGETRTKFRLRFNNHSFSIRKNLKGFPVATHFNRPDHSLQHLKFAVIAGNFKSDDHRKTAEIKLILKLKCNVNGLNRDLSFIAKHGNLLQGTII
ncbi:hypothetical protein HOLleu_02640 [Holothuria leucospilota]|uniref:GIY-YIG domain-containing protein n=1 Tax=Holothuria leucospilota TaxID=206669 RepID=A0A9Q1HH63_HOLLE|nr:hypothetical protein HOLleu_02640 [Holothuria leucospilota]